MKYYFIENTGDVGMAKELPQNAVEISKENFNHVKKNIRFKHFRKLVGKQVVEKNSEEKTLAKNIELAPKERAITNYKIGRRSYRLVRLPFDYAGKKIRLEEGDLRATPYGIFSTWDNFIRDAVMCELSGNSILPIKFWADDNSVVNITTPQELYAMHQAMTASNKAVLEGEIDMRQMLNQSTTYASIQEVRALNRGRTK